MFSKTTLATLAVSAALLAAPAFAQTADAGTDKKDENPAKHQLHHKGVHHKKEESKDKKDAAQQ